MSDRVQPLRKSPIGLLELLSLKTAGYAPDSIDLAVGASIDTRYHYAADILETQAGPQTIGSLAAGIVDQFTLPANVGLHAVGGALTVGAAGGTNLRIAVCINVKTLLVSIPIYETFVPAFAAAQVVEFGAALPPWVIPAGCRIFARAYGTAAGGDHALNVAALIEDFSNR